MTVVNRLAAMMGKKQAAENRLITVAVVARETGLSRQAIYNWLHGDIEQYRSETVELFCRYFGCTVDDLLVIEREAAKESA